MGAMFFYSIFDAVIADLQLRFEEKQIKAAKLSKLIPANISSNWEEDH